MCVCVYTHVEIPLHKSKETREHWHIFTGAGVAQHPTHKCIFTLTKLQKSVYNPFYACEKGDMLFPKNI